MRISRSFLVTKVATKPTLQSLLGLLSLVSCQGTPLDGGAQNVNNSNQADCTYTCEYNVSNRWDDMKAFAREHSFNYVADSAAADALINEVIASDMQMNSPAATDGLPIGQANYVSVCRKNQDIHAVFVLARSDMSLQDTTTTTVRALWGQDEPAARFMVDYELARLDKSERRMALLVPPSKRSWWSDVATAWRTRWTERKDLAVYEAPTPERGAVANELLIFGDHCGFYPGDPRPLAPLGVGKDAAAFRLAQPIDGKPVLSLRLFPHVDFRQRRAFAEQLVREDARWPMFFEQPDATGTCALAEEFAFEINHERISAQARGAAEKIINRTAYLQQIAEIGRFLNEKPNVAFEDFSLAFLPENKGSKVLLRDLEGLLAPNDADFAGDRAIMFDILKKAKNLLRAQ